MKIAILICHTGTPDAPTTPALGRYLKELFYQCSPNIPQ
jgi:hypothetical protein